MTDVTGKSDGAASMPAARPSNWGRWGEDDGDGALNLLNETRVLAALSMPRRGRIYRLGAVVGKNAPLSGPRNPTWHDATQFIDPTDPGRGGAEDMLVMHTHSSTHLDGLAHCWYGGRLYNGVAADQSISRVGTRYLAMHDVRPVIGRAVLLDVASLVGPLAEGDLIDGDLLSEAEAASGCTVQSGDIILIRCGWMDVFAQDPARYGGGEPGLAQSAAEWLADKDPALLGMDNFGFEPLPPRPGVSPLYCHELFLRDLGVHLLESMDLSQPAADRVAEGLFIMAPLRVARGLGSPVNPLLVV